jgi:hypothetical protein
VLAVCGEPGPVARRWTRWLCGELGALHHWDLPAPPRIIRVFLLPGWLEIDLTFAPEEEFGPRGPQWRTIFGQARPLEPFPAPDPDTLAVGDRGVGPGQRADRDGRQPDHGPPGRLAR